MELLVNDLSLHGQFHDTQSFREAMARMMSLRNVAQQFGREIHCYRALLWAQAIRDVPMQQALGRLTESERRSAIMWLTRSGPFWDDLRTHGAGDWFECAGDVVTDSAVAEAAHKSMQNVECGLVSFRPSNWDYSPLEVTYKYDVDGLIDQHAMLHNLREATELRERLRDASLTVTTWNQLRSHSVNQYQNLIFSDDCFQPLSGVPFAQSSAERIRLLLSILDRFAQAFDVEGRRTHEGQEIYENYFTGDNALFSDSSPTEKRKYRQELTFAHPNGSGTRLFCTWHGKERRMTLRLHYWWSGKMGEPVYVVYVGRKLTIR